VAYNSAIEVYADHGCTDARSASPDGGGRRSAPSTARLVRSSRRYRLGTGAPEREPLTTCLTRKSVRIIVMASTQHDGDSHADCGRHWWH
jgi:hypothetical protein